MVSAPGGECRSEIIASHRTAALAFDPQEPRREGAQRLVQRFLAGRQRIGAVAAPGALRWLLEARHVLFSSFGGGTAARSSAAMRSRLASLRAFAQYHSRIKLEVETFPGSRSMRSNSSWGIWASFCHSTTDAC
jgi:hypothetical protein